MDPTIKWQCFRINMEGELKHQKRRIVKELPAEIVREGVNTDLDLTLSE